jgi:rubrerythrin
MDIETKGYDLYASAASDTAELAARSLYNYLAKMESRHFKILQDAYGYLTHPDHWYDDEEKPIFEGG